MSDTLPGIAPAPVSPVCALCRKRPGVARYTSRMFGEQWHCADVRCTRLATSGRKLYLQGEPAPCDSFRAPGDNPGARVVRTGE